MPKPLTFEALARMSPNAAANAMRGAPVPPPRTLPTGPTPAQQAMQDRAQLARDMAAGKREDPRVQQAQALWQGGPAAQAADAAERAKSND